LGAITPPLVSLLLFHVMEVRAMLRIHHPVVDVFSGRPDLRWSLWSTGARTPSHRRRLGTKRTNIWLRNSILVYRIREQEMVARDSMRMYKVKCVQEFDGGDFLAVFRFMEESLSWRKKIWRWPA
jgi:hypothetical protein